MKYSNKKLLAMIALIGATLYGSSAVARRVSQRPTQNGHVVLHPHARPDSFDAVIKDGSVVGMTGVMKDGRRIAFKPQSKPTCTTGCPEGQKLYCWEDEEEMMSMCVCTSGGGGGSIILEDLFVTS